MFGRFGFSNRMGQQMQDATTMPVQGPTGFTSFGQMPQAMPKPLMGQLGMGQMGMQRPGMQSFMPQQPFMGAQGYGQPQQMMQPQMQEELGRTGQPPPWKQFSRFGFQAPVRK